MIVVDSSAACAILFHEPEKPRFEEVIAANRTFLPASCLVEISITYRRYGGAANVLDHFVRELDLTILPFDARQALIAVEADRRFGRGCSHPARLNFGDCLAYAAAMAHGAPLLFKGDDFAHTDVTRAV